MKKVIPFLLTILFLVSCGQSSENAFIESQESGLRLMAADAKTVSKDVSQNTSQVQIEKKLIKNGSVSYETYDLEATRKSVLEAIKNFGGYTSSDNSYTSSDRVSTTINARIPAKSFDDFLQEISKGVERFDSKNISVRDVTEQFLDVEARLKTKKKLEEKFLQLLEKAKTVREILDVERQLANVRSEIESTEGRLKYLSNQVSYSKLNITFYKMTSNEPSFVRRAKEGFKNGISNLSSFFIGVINVWPFVILIILVIALLRRWRKKRNK